MREIRCIAARFGAMQNGN